jgi:hypothetical protein
MPVSTLSLLLSFPCHMSATLCTTAMVLQVAMIGAGRRIGLKLVGIAEAQPQLTRLRIHVD